MFTCPSRPAGCPRRCGKNPLRSSWYAALAVFLLNLLGISAHHRSCHSSRQLSGNDGGETRPCRIQAGPRWSLACLLLAFEACPAGFQALTFLGGALNSIRLNIGAAFNIGQALSSWRGLSTNEVWPPPGQAFLPNRVVRRGAGTVICEAPLLFRCRQLTVIALQQRIQCSGALPGRSLFQGMS